MMPQEDIPSDPFNVLITDATHLHELYVTLQAGGFTPYEALVFLATAIRSLNATDGS